MAEVLPWQNSPDPRAVLARAVAALGEGRRVAFPTESTYVLAARAAAPCPGETLAVSCLDQAVALVPCMSVMGRRLARRCWPGPVTLQFPDAPALCCPAHSAILHALHELGCPLAVTALGVTTAEEAARAAGESVDLVIDDGPCRFALGPTVVRVEGERWEVVQEGAVPPEQLRVQAATVLVFVCTGNTCRSPLAEALCRKRLAERLGCAPDELPQRGLVILSAGVSAYDGDQAAAPAVEIAREYGADLSGHVSQHLDRHLAAQADHLVCMTAGHLQTLLALFPQLGCEPRLLSPAGTDLPDPVGQDESVYRTCAAQIWQDLEPLVAQLAG